MNETETPTVPSKQFLKEYYERSNISDQTEFLQYTLELTNVGMMLENHHEFSIFTTWIEKTGNDNNFNYYVWNVIIWNEFRAAFKYANDRNYVYGRIYHYLNLLQKFIKHELNLNKSYHHHIEQRSLRSHNNRSHKSFLNETYIFKLRYNGDMLYNKSIKKLIGNPNTTNEENSLESNLKSYNFFCDWMTGYLHAEYAKQTYVIINKILHQGFYEFYNMKRQYPSNQIFIHTYDVVKNALLAYWSTNNIRECRIILSKLYIEFKSAMNTTQKRKRRTL